MFAELAAAGGPASELMLDSTYVKMHHTAAGRPQRASVHAVGRSRGGRTTKLHALVDGQGRPVTLAITPGQRGDTPVAIGLLRQAPLSRTLAADADYDSNALQQILVAYGTTPVIPKNPGESAITRSSAVSTNGASSSNARSAA